MSDQSAKDVVDELFRRQEAGDETVLDDLVAEDMINHAAGPQGREGLRLILATINHDLETAKEITALGGWRRYLSAIGK